MNKKYLTVNGKKIPFIHGGKGACFPAGTIISAPVGNIPIEKIMVGDHITSFDYEGNLKIGKVSETFYHPQERVISCKLWNNKTITATPNHWFLNEHGTFTEFSKFQIDSVLVDENNNVIPIAEINTKTDIVPVYNFTVEDDHTYIANGIRVHNKGGGKDGANPPFEEPNTLFSTDVLFLSLALGEGPVYRINPNGAQDIEVNEGITDDLLDFATGNTNPEVLIIKSTTGTLTQPTLPVFGTEIITGQSLSNGIELKKGNIPGVPKASIERQSTSVDAWDSLRFIFAVRSLFRMNDNGDILGNSLSIRITVRNSKDAIIRTVNKTISGKTNSNYKFEVEVTIPEELRDPNGYIFSIEKTSPESDKSKVSDSVVFSSWLEIQSEDQAYPRTAIIGYALKSFAEFTGNIPTFTNLTKGLLCKVPSNYDQPILENGDIDWRQLEVSDTGSLGYPTVGYFLQSTESTILGDINPVIYKGLWDGTFRLSWTQNPIWIIYDLLTNTSYGLGIPEDNIDKFKFYKVAQFCDGVDFKTGKWFGVDGFTDGTFRHKPRGYLASSTNSLFTNKNLLLGLPRGTRVKERRFTCNITISTQQQAIDIIGKIAALFRGSVFYFGGKVSINIDMPDDLPVAIFNEANIKKESMVISGIQESEILTGVEVTYVEPSNHYRREIIKVDDTKALAEQNQIEKVAEIELVGCTKRSQATRMAQYLLAASKFVRRNVEFETSAEALHLTVGDVIAVAQQQIGVAWGYGGKIAANSVIGGTNFTLEHFTSPAITPSTFTANTLPMGLRIIYQDSDIVDYYQLSNVVSMTATGNASTGVDLIEVTSTARFIPDTKQWSFAPAFIGPGGTQGDLSIVPVKGDLWTVGEIDPDNFFRSKNDKLFKITSIERSSDEGISLKGSEFISNVFVDSEELINYTPVKYEQTFSSLIPPPAPALRLFSRAVRRLDGGIATDIEVIANTDLTGYPISIETIFQYSSPSVSQVVEIIE